MDHVDILLKLKDLLKDTCGKQALIRLIQFPLIMDYLSEPGNLQLLIEKFGPDYQNWSPTQICRTASHLDQKSSVSTSSQIYVYDEKRAFENSINPESIEKFDSIVDIYPFAEELTFKSKRQTWSQILEQIELCNLALLNDPKKRLETIFEVIFEISDDRKQIINDLFKFSVENAGNKLLSRLILNDKSVSDYVIETLNKKSLYPSPQEIVSLIREMQILGDKDLFHNLANVYISSFPYEENFQNINERRGIEVDLIRLQYYKNYATLFQIIGDSENFNKISIILKEILSIFGKELGFKTYFEKNEDLSIDSTANNNSRNDLVQKIKRIKDISRTDNESGIKFGIELAGSILDEPDLLGAIFDDEQGFLIEPENLVRSFVDAGLFEQAQAILNKFLLLWPQNISLLRIAANFAHDKGDHDTASKEFAILYVYDELIREEKNKFAASLEYLDFWEIAYKIRSSVNISTEDDFRQLFLCAFNAEKNSLLPDLIADNEQFTRSSKNSSLLQMIAEEDTEKTIALLEKLEISDYYNEKDQYYFLLTSDFLRKAGKIDKAKEILENCLQSSKFIFPYINRLYSIYQEIGKREKSHAILKSVKAGHIKNQNDLETYLDFLIQCGEIECANHFLLNVKKSWELSPRMIYLTSRILIETGNFSEAEKKLLPLVKRENQTIEYNFFYFLALLRCKFDDFPIGIDYENAFKLEEFETGILPNEANKSILLEILDAEVADNCRFEKYQNLLNKYLSSSNPETWRIYAGLGKMYFNQKQFDSAIINLKHARQACPKNQAIFWLLVSCFAHLRLWNEVEELFEQNSVRDCRSILTNFRAFGDFKEISDWWRFLENQTQRKPDEIVYKVFLAQSYVETGKTTEAVDLIKGFLEKLNVNDEFYLQCAQILIDGGEAQLAERLIEIFLVNKHLLDQSDQLACSYLFDQMGKHEKALSMINQVDDRGIAFLMYKAKLLNDLGKTERSQKLINDIILNEGQVTHLQDCNSVRIPQLVKQVEENPALPFLMAATYDIEEKNIEQSISILQSALGNYPNDQNLLFNLLELLTLSGKNESIEKILAELSYSDSEISSPSLLCLLGEISLSNGDEVMSAKYLSNAMVFAADNPRVKALQARLVAINGNLLDAKRILTEIVELLEKPELNIFNNPVELYGSKSKIWLAQAANDLKVNNMVLALCKDEISRFGHLVPLEVLFLSALSEELEKQILGEELKIYNHINSNQEEWLKILANVIKNYSTSHNSEGSLEQLITKCQILLKNDIKINSAAELIEPNPENINAIIFAILKSKGLEAAEIAFNSFTTNDDNEFFLAVLEKDLSPEKSLEHLKKINQSAVPDAMRNTLLAIIEKNIGNLANAYAAISLALEECPDEYEWQIMAGDLSKQKGDLHTSISHYQKAQRIKLSQGINNQLDDHILTLGSVDAIPFLEKELSQKTNLDQMIQLGKIYITAGNYRKAVRIFELARNEYPQEADPYFWLCEIALNLSNPEKALNHIEEALTRDGMNVKYILKKAELLKIIKDYSLALDFINQILSNNEINDIRLLRYKVKLISENLGDEEAIKVLETYPGFNEIPELLLESALIGLRQGKISESELIAEGLINHKNVRAEALELLGSISKTKGDLDRAIDYFIKSIEADPFPFEKFIKLAEIYHDIKSFKSAMQTLEDGIRVNPGNFELLYRSGLYFYQQGVYNEAEKNIREAIKIKPEHREAKELLSLLENVTNISNFALVNQNPQ